MTEAPSTAPTGRAAAERRIRPPWVRRRVILTAIAVVGIGGAIASAHAVSLSPSTLWQGWGAIRSIGQRAWPPRWDDFGFDVSQGWLSFCTAVVATAIATLLAFPLALLAARTTTPNRIVGAVARALIVVCRAIPGLVLALILAAALQIGPLPGALGLGLHSIGMVGKLLADALEDTDPGPAEALRAAGAGRWQTTFGAVVPQVVPSYASTVLYRLEINMRDSAVVGLVGGGGIGFWLQSALETDRWPTSLGLILIIVAYVLVVEQAGSLIRNRLLRPRPTGADGRTRALSPRWTARRIASRVAAAATLGLVLYSCAKVGLTPGPLWRGLPKLGTVGRQLITPDFSHFGTLANELLETFEIGLVGTVLGLALAFPTSFLAARTVAPARWVTYAARYVLVVVRALPELAVAVVFVAAVGLGPFAGVLALAVVSFGFGAKLLADNMELEPPGPREAATASGASRAQALASATIPSQLPGLVGASLYDLDISLRTSTILGVVGAGGVGYGLEESIRTLSYHVTGAYLLGIFVLVYALELVAVRIRALLA